jgi:hypothetical protein
MKFFNALRQSIQPADPHEKEYANDVVRKGEAILNVVFTEAQLAKWQTAGPHTTVPGSHWKSFFAKEIMNHFIKLNDSEVAFIYADAGDAVATRAFVGWDEFWKVVRKVAIKHLRNPSLRPPQALEAAE